jgi:hypothetical protein
MKKGLAIALILARFTDPYPVFPLNELFKQCLTTG